MLGADRAAARRDRADARLAVDADQHTARDDERGAQRRAAGRRAPTRAGRARRASRPRATPSRRSARRPTRVRGRTPRRGGRTRGRNRGRPARTRRAAVAVSRARVASANPSATAAPVEHRRERGQRRDRRRCVGRSSQRTRLSRARERDRPDERKTSPIRLKCSGSRSVAREDDAARRRSARRRATSPATSGSSRKTRAIATANSGAVPTVTDVREAPASRTAKVNRICETPGASSPARRNGHALATFHSPCDQPPRSR